MKLEFRSGEALEDSHGSTTLGAKIKIGVFGSGRVELLRRFLCCAQQLEANRQGAGAPSASQETKMPDAYEALREQMQQESTQEAIVGQSGELLLVGAMAPAEGHLAIGKGDQTMIGDGHTMGVAAQIVQHLLRTTEGALPVDHPVLPKQRS